MNAKVNATNEDIMNEISGIEYEDDDALTLLDDEEMQISTQTTDDEDLNSFYLDYATPVDEKEVVDLYTEEVVKKEETKIENVEPQSVHEDAAESISTVSEPVKVPDPVIPTVAQSPEVTNIKGNGYQNKLNQLSTNIDAYLNGSLDNRKDEVKVEKMDPVVVKAASISQPMPSVPPMPKTESTKPVPAVTSVLEQAKANTQSENKNIDTNLNQLFAKVSDNIRGATDVKRKMEDRYKELQKMYDDFEKKKKDDYAEINSYKDEVYNKLKIKKEELDEQTRKLKLEQDTLANQKKQFETEKQRIKEEAKKKEQEMLDAFKEREKNIEQVENGLIRRKEQLDLEKVKIAKERAQCEQEKKELADNLVKFNQLVDDFTKGVDRFSENN